VAVLGHSSAIVAINAVVTISPVSHVVGQTPPAPTLLSPAEIDGVAHAVCADNHVFLGREPLRPLFETGGRVVPSIRRLGNSQRPVSARPASSISRMPLCDLGSKMTLPSSGRCPVLRANRFAST
jgi:hypothetical protein